MDVVPCATSHLGDVWHGFGFWRVVARELMTKQDQIISLAGGFKNCCMFNPENWGDDPIWLAHIFQWGGEKPPAIVSGVRISSNTITYGSMSSDESCGCLTCGVIFVRSGLTAWSFLSGLVCSSVMKEDERAYLWQIIDSKALLGHIMDHVLSFRDMKLFCRKMPMYVSKGCQSLRWSINTVEGEIERAV